MLINGVSMSFKYGCSVIPRIGYSYPPTVFSYFIDILISQDTCLIRYFIVGADRLNQGVFLIINAAYCTY